MVNREEINGKVLARSEHHTLVWLGTDEHENEGVVQTNQYLIIHKGKGILVDPGGVHLFARVVSAVSRFISLESIEHILFSHQDPDVSSGIALWMGVTKARIYISNLWLRFLPHFGIVDNSRIVGLEGLGGKLPVDFPLLALPAHFLHSTGNYSFYDQESKTLFSGDIGAAVFPRGGQYVFVQDFDSHVKYMSDFHRRYMGSSKVLKKWVQSVASLPIEYIAPQHGAIFPQPQAKQFLDWLITLECGIDILDAIYKQ
ncbi:MAG: MBL fold metallo-hydrolase [Spirochaetales bacterium]